MKTSTYAQQANDFLEATNTSLTIAFSHKGKHFEEDKEDRNIYNVKLSNKKHTYCFTFGDSINNTRQMQNARTQAEMLKYKPTKYDILACLNVSYEDDFKGFCDEFGYEQYDYDNEVNNFLNESAFVTFKAVQKETENLKLLFSSDELEMLQEIQ